MHQDYIGIYGDRFCSVNSTECDILRCFWDSGHRLSCVEVYHKMRELRRSERHRSPNRSTITVQLRRMRNKKLLRGRVLDNKLYYYPVDTREEMIDKIVKDVYLKLGSTKELQV